ncbi:hypothetical protein ACJJTC_016988 [Scirpophaga incertulas]
MIMGTEIIPTHLNLATDAIGSRLRKSAAFADSGAGAAGASPGPITPNAAGAQDPSGVGDTINFIQLNLNTNYHASGEQAGAPGAPMRFDSDWAGATAYIHGTSTPVGGALATGGKSRALSTAAQAAHAPAHGPANIVAASVDV